MIDEVERASEKAFESYKKHFGIVHPSGVHPAVVFSDPFAEKLKRYDIIGEPETKKEILETLYKWTHGRARIETIVSNKFWRADQIKENLAVIIWGYHNKLQTVILNYCFNFGRF